MPHCEVLIEPEREDMQKMLRRAVARGEVSPRNTALDYGCTRWSALIARDLMDRPPERPASSVREAVVLPALERTPQPADGR